MIDCHFHTRTEDNSTPEKRADLADWLRDELDAMDLDRVVLIGKQGSSVEECRGHNRNIAAYVEEHPDIFYGWARVNPEWGEDAVDELHRAVEEDGLVGLKHHSVGSKVPCSDPAFEPLAEACVELDVPIIEHCMHRQEPWLSEIPYETWTEDVVALAEKYPDLKLISAHIGGGGDWEYRIKNIQDYDNVYLDISGSGCDAGMVEMAAEYLGADRLVYGSDNAHIPDVGKLAGAEITPEQKVEVAFKMEDLIRDDVPNKWSEEEYAERRRAQLGRFRAVEEPREETIVDANAYVGHWPFMDIDASAEDLVALMDRKGVDKAVVSSIGATLYRNCHTGNRELAQDVQGHEDRLIPLATINPTYPAWKRDLEECLEEFDMKGVKLLPAYHDYDLNRDEVEELMDHCADLDVPVIIAGPLEDQRQRHPRVELRGFEGMGKDYFREEQADQIIDLLKSCPDTDVVVANVRGELFRIAEETSERRDGIYLRNEAHTGELYFVLGKPVAFLYVEQGKRIAEEIGPDRLVSGPQLPFKTFESYYEYTQQLPVSEEERQRVRSENALSLFE